MAGAVNTSYTFTDTDVITSSKMNNIIGETVMTTQAIIGSTLAVSTGGQLRVNTSGITANELATSSVTTTAILDANVTTAKIADDAITTAKIADDAITTAKIADDAITTVKVPDANITTAKIADAAITAPKLNGAQTGTAPVFGARAWVNFDGTVVTNVGGEDRCTIRSSGNVSKVVRSVTGTFVIHFTEDMPNNDYVVAGMTNQVILGNRSTGWTIRGTDDSLMTTSSVTIDTGSVSAGSAANMTVNAFCIIG